VRPALADKFLSDLARALDLAVPRVWVCPDCGRAVAVEGGWLSEHGERRPDRQRCPGGGRRVGAKAGGDS
jgi:hypothetical protein